MPDAPSDLQTDAQCDVEMRGDYLILFDRDGNQLESSRCVSLPAAKAALGYWYFVKGYDWINGKACGNYITNYFANHSTT